MTNVIISAFSLIFFILAAQILWAIKGHPELGESFATACIGCAASFVFFLVAIIRASRKGCGR